MVKTFKVGDRVSWNSEAGRVRGKIVKVHRQNVNYKGYVHHASRDDPQYEIKSDKTDHVALHKAGDTSADCRTRIRICISKHDVSVLHHWPFHASDR